MPQLLQIETHRLGLTKTGERKGKKMEKRERRTEGEQRRKMEERERNRANERKGRKKKA
jgi:hypothetical protein